MKLQIKELEQKVSHLIPIYSGKFHISPNGSKEFLRLAIIESIKMIAELDLTQIKNDFIMGDEPRIQALIKEIENWKEDEFNLEDFEIIGYCKNIR